MHFVDFVDIAPCQTPPLTKLRYIKSSCRHKVSPQSTDSVHFYSVYSQLLNVNTVGHYLKKPRRYHGECCAQGGPKAKTRGAAGPEGFGRGTSRGTTFTMIPPRFFHKMSLLQLPGLVKRDFFQVGFGQWTPQGVQWILYRGWRVNIGRVKSQCTSPGCYNNGAFNVTKGSSQNIFLQVPFFLVLTSRTCFRFTDFQFLHKLPFNRPGRTLCHR